MTEKNIKILLVDDEPDILEFLEYNLSKEGYQVYTAQNGKEAVKKAEETKPNLIILDIMMPEQDGIETCRQLRANSKFNNTIIAFLTARNEDFSQIAGFEVGADDFINKPIKPRVFISRVKGLLRRYYTADADMKIIVGDIEIDREKYLVFKNGQKIELPRKEFELFHLLASQPGKAFPREEIMNKVWGEEVIVGDRTIDVHVRKLREKMGETYIKTVKGVGYKFDL